jgi:hypothetical protein
MAMLLDTRISNNVIFRRRQAAGFMKAGDRVTVIGIPPDARDDEVLPTRSVFEKCLGRSFTVTAVEDVDGSPRRLARLEVGAVLDEPPWRHTIWVEEEYLRIELPI